MNGLNLTIETAVEANNGYIAVEKNFNGFFDLDVSDGKASIIDLIPYELFNGYRLCSKILIRKEKIYFVPMNASSLYIYDKDKKIWKRIKVKKDSRYMIDKFFQAFFWRNYLVMIGCRYPAIAFFDLKKEKIFYYTEPYTRYINLQINVGDCFFRTSYVLKNDVLYLASCLTNEVVKVDLDILKTDYFNIGSNNDRFSGIDYDGDDFWISPRVNSGIVRWNEDCGYVDQYNLPENSLDNKPHYLGIYCIDGYVFMPTFRGEFSIEINNINKPIIRVIECNYNFVEKSFDCKRLFGQKESGEFFQKEDDVISGTKYNVNKKELERKWRDCKIINEIPIYLEYDFFCLRDYIYQI